MSDAKVQARQRAIDYMVQLLQMNPVHEGAAIIAVRNDALGLTKKAPPQPAVPVDVQKEDRRKLLDQLEALRRQFWTMPLDALNQQLSALDGQGFADLEAAVKRLRIVAAHRAKFPALAQHADFSGEIFSSLKEILTRSPRDTAVLREQVLAKFRNRSHRKSGRKMIALLKRELPAIYALEADWFDTLDRQKVQTSGIHLVGQRRDNTAPAGNGTNFGSYWWVIVLISGMVRACTSTMDHHNTGSSSRNRPSYNYSPPSVREYQPPATPRRLVPEPNPNRRFDRISSPAAPRPQIEPSPDNQKGVWEPYPLGEQANQNQSERAMSPVGMDSPFGQPKYVNPHLPSTGLNDRYPR